MKYMSDKDSVKKDQDFKEVQCRISTQATTTFFEITYFWYRRF